MTGFLRGIRRLLRDESGATALEYGLLVALIAAALIGAIIGVGDGLTATFERLESGLDRP